MAAPVLSVEPASPVVQLGNPFSLDIVVSGVTDLFAFQFDVEFDPATLHAGAVTEGPFLPRGGATTFLPGTIDNAAGAVRLTAGTLIGSVPGVTGSGVLATLDFSSVRAGASRVAITSATLLDSSLFDIGFTTTSATVHVTPEPEVASLSVIGLGVLLAAKARRRC
jgi:hypothetical protein